MPGSGLRVGRIAVARRKSPTPYPVRHVAHEFGQADKRLSISRGHFFAPSLNPFAFHTAQKIFPVQVNGNLVNALARLRHRRRQPPGRPPESSRRRNADRFRARSDKTLRRRRSGLCPISADFALGDVENVGSLARAQIGPKGVEDVVAGIHRTVNKEKKR